MAIKRIYSSGGIVALDGKVLLTQHSKHKGWDFPKGHIEAGESEEDAALREVAEETGVKAEIVEKIGQTEYFYYEEGERVFKKVVFFLMKFLEQGEATTAFEVSDMAWLSPDEVEEKLTFKDTKELWKKAIDKVKEFELKG